MGIKMRGVSNEKKKKQTESSAAAMSQSSSLRGIMILVTMRMIGLPVDVHVKDGSVYSGIFDAASVDGGYGVVLKKARLLKRGTRVSNIASGIIVDTLWVLPGDLVQVVAKDVILSADGVSSGMVFDDAGAADSTKASVRQYSETDEVSADVDLDKEKLKMNHKRQVEAGAYVNGAVNGCSLQKTAIVENQSSLSSKLLLNERPLENGGIPDAKSLPNGHSTLTAAEIPSREVCSSVSKPTKPVGNIISNKNHASADVLVASQNKVTTRKVQESKLNPGAKAFSPSTVNVAPTVSSMTYVQNNHRMVAITPQPEDGIRPMAPHSSVTSKLVPPGNFAVANGGNELQYAQPVQFTGHIANRAQPVRYNGLYQPVQAEVPYMPSNPPNLSQGMIERVGQVVYVHPVVQDMVQMDAVLHVPQPVSAPHQILIPKHDGMDGFVFNQPPQLSLTPPPMQQPFPLPGHLQVSQPPFPAIRPITVLASNCPYDVKFL